MRLMFFGPRIFGIRPGVSFTPQELMSGFAGSTQKAPGEQMTGSFVYVVRGDHNMVKVGVSTNPNARLAQLRTGSAYPIDFAFIGSTPGTGYDIEQAAHALLDRHRCNGEWFDVPPEMAVAAVTASAHRLNQPIVQVNGGQVDQILRIAHGQEQLPAPQGQSSGWLHFLMPFIIAFAILPFVVLALHAIK
jgi:hypothetical protein